MTDREELTMNGHGDHNKAATESAADISEEDIVLDEDEETADAASGKAVSTSGQKVSNKENAGEAVLVSNTVTGNYFELHLLKAFLNSLLFHVRMFYLTDNLDSVMIEIVKESRKLQRRISRGGNFQHAISAAYLFATGKKS